MTKTVVTGGHEDLNLAITTILAGGTPVIAHIIRTQPGFWIILHSA